jgi:hypothetical protein
MIKLPSAYSLVCVTFFMVIATGAFAQHNFELQFKLPIDKYWEAHRGSKPAAHPDDTNEKYWASIFEQLTRGIDLDKIAAYDNSQKPATSKDLCNAISYHDTIDDGGAQKVIEFEILRLSDLYYNFDALDLTQKWTIQDNGKIEKTMLAYAPLSSKNIVFKNESAGKSGTHTPIFWIHPGTTDTGTTFEVSYSFNLSDLANKGDSAALVSSIINGLKAGTIKGYGPMDDQQPPLNKTEIDNAFNPGIDLVQVMDSTGQEWRTVARPRPLIIDQLKFKEEWKVDGRGNFTVRVKDYGLAHRMYSPTGDFLATAIMVMMKN